MNHLKFHGCLVVTLFTILSGIAHAESHVGNGGHEVICPHERSLLDIYEAEQDPGFKVDLGTSPKFTDMFFYALSKLGELDPGLYQQIRGYSFFVFLSSRAPGNPAVTNDAGNYHIAPDCSLSQLITQTLDDGRHFVFGADWESLDALNQASAMLHETLYAYALDNGQTTSELTRSFVRFLVSDRSASIGQQDYLALRHSFGFDPKHELKGFRDIGISGSNNLACDEASRRSETDAYRWCSGFGATAVLRKYAEHTDLLEETGGGEWQCVMTNSFLCNF